MNKTKVTICAIAVIVIVIIAVLANGSTIFPYEPRTSPEPSLTQTPTPTVNVTPTSSPVHNSTNSPTLNPTPKLSYPVGISVHALNSSDAKFVGKSGASWVRIDVSPDFSFSLF